MQLLSVYIIFKLFDDLLVLFLVLVLNTIAKGIFVLMTLMSWLLNQAENQRRLNGQHVVLDTSQDSSGNEAFLINLSIYILFASRSYKL